MNPALKFFALLLLINTSADLPAQERPIENALLWKVTGNSLSKPSFLFGTMHLQDKRLFNFSDSLYSFIKAADGFALEIHPDSVVAAIMATFDDDEDGHKARLLKDHLPRKEFDQVSRKLKKDLGIDARKLTVRDAYLLRDHLSNPEPRADDMPTFVDAYLYGVARNQGKEIAGLEKASDQVNMLDEIKGELDFPKVITSIKKTKSLTEKLIQLYISEDLRSIHQMMSMLPEETEEKLLTMRNVLMADKMDSLIRVKSFVVAVGTAHLPGGKGIIELLRKKGYRVEPVFATSRTHANDYSVKAEQQLNWYEVKEPKQGYTARMPGKPSAKKMLNGDMDMNMYMDLTTMRAYFTAFLVPYTGIGKENADSMLLKMSENAMSGSNGKLISSKRFARDGFEAIDFLYKEITSKNFARVQCFAREKRVYMAGMTSTRQQDLETAEAEHFYKSFVIQDMPEQVWQQHTFNDDYFSIALPSEPSVRKLKPQDTTISSVQYMGVDNVAGSYFGTTVVTVTPGFVIQNDANYLASSVERMRANMELDSLDEERDTTVMGFAAKWMSSRIKDSMFLQCLVVNRGNRIYHNLAILSAADTARERLRDFFSSFRLIDYPPLEWKPQQFPEYGFSMPATGGIQRVTYMDDLEDSAAAGREFQLTFFDPASATSYYVTRRKMSPYQWAAHDSVILKQMTKSMIAANETLMGYKYVRNGNSNGIEIDVRKNESSLRQRIRIVLNGHGIYLLQSDAPRVYWDKYDYVRFMESFRPGKEMTTGYLRTNSLARLLADLSSPDSATNETAYAEIEKILYDSTQIPALLAAGSRAYPGDSARFHPAGNVLLSEVAKLEHTDDVSLIAKHYRSLTPAQNDFRYSVLELLAKKYTSESYDTLLQLWKMGLPPNKRYSNIVSHLRDSLQLSRKLYPFLLHISADTAIGTALFNLHTDMLDSNLVQLQEFRQYQDVILRAAANELRLIAADTSSVDYYYTAGIFELMRVLGELGTAPATARLKEFLTASRINIKYRAAIELLKRGERIAPQVLSDIAADKYYRIDLYNEMKKAGVQAMFPAKYFNLKSLAESYLYNAVSEDDPTVMEYVGERIVEFRGARKKFLLYKLGFGEGAERSYYLGIAGAYDAGGKSILIAEEDALSGMYFDEEFKQALIGKHLKAYLAQYESAAEPPPVEE